VAAPAESNSVSTKVEDEIVRLLIERAPNAVNEGILRRSLSEYGEAAVTATLEELVQSNRIVEQTDPRTAIGRPLRYYQLSSFQGIPIQENIKVGDVEVPRLLSIAGVGYFPEDFNEAVGRLAEHSAGLEKRFGELVRKEQRAYWGNIVSIFGVFVAILAFVLVGMPKITTDPSLAFWEVVKLNGAQLLPLAFILALFVLVLRWVIR